MMVNYFLVTKGFYFMFRSALTTLLLSSLILTAVPQFKTVASEIKCTDRDVLTLYEAVDEFKIRIDVGINYIDFDKHYTDLEILKSRVAAHASVECLESFNLIKRIISSYGIVRSLWGHSITVYYGEFFPAMHVFVTPFSNNLSLKQYSFYDEPYVSTEILKRLYIQETLKDFEKLKNLINK